MTKLLPVIMLAVVVGITAVIAPQFFQVQNLINVARQGAIVGVVSVGMTFVILTAGIDLSVGSVLAVAASVTAILIAAGYPIPVVILLVVLIGCAIGLINGAGITGLGIQPFIMTLATMAIARGFALRITEGYPKYFDSDSKLLGFFGAGKVFGIPGALLVFLGLAAVGWVVLRYFRFGRYVYAVGGSAEAARLSGVRTRAVTLATYVISGGCAAIAGVMTASRLGVGAPIAGQLVELDAIAAVVIGGTTLMGGAGGLAGTVAGALLLAVLSNLLNILGVSPFDQLIVKGVVIVVAVLAASPRLRESLASFNRRGRTPQGHADSPTAGNGTGPVVGEEGSQGGTEEVTVP